MVVLWITIFRGQQICGRAFYRNARRVSEYGQCGLDILKEVGSPDFKIEYLWRENTFKLRFTNNNPMGARMKYRLRADLRRMGKGWKSSGWLDAAVSINGKATQLDNFPVPTGTEEIRNVEVDVVDWEYYPVNK